MLGRDALAEITGAQLLATVEATPVDDVNQAGFVLDQEPKAGDQLRRKGMVILYVGDHPDAVLLPPEKPAPPKRRRPRPQAPALFDDSVGQSPEPSPGAPDASEDLTAAASPSAVRSPRLAPAWPGPAQRGEPAADVNHAPSAAESELPPPSAREPEPPAAAFAPAAEEDITDAQFVDTEDPATEVLDPDQVSDTAAIERPRPPRPRARRRRPQSRARRLSGRQTLALGLSCLVILYLAVALLGSPAAHRPAGHATHATTPVRSPRVTAATQTTSAQTVTTVTTVTTTIPRRTTPPRPRASHPAAARSQAAATTTSTPSTAAPSTPVFTPSAPPAPVTSSAGAPPVSAPARTSPSRPSRSSASSPLSPMGPIGPAPNQP